MKYVRISTHKLAWFAKRGQQYSKLFGHSYHVDKQLILKVGHVRLLCRLLRFFQTGLKISSQLQNLLL